MPLVSIHSVIPSAEGLLSNQRNWRMRSVLLLFLVASVVAAQSAPPRKDIPAIAKAANGAIVSIIMSDKDGSPIGQGTGFLISKDGRIVTNYHVIENGSSAIVKLPDGAFFVVDGVLAFDKPRDVAVIKAHGENFRTLTLGNSDRLQVGEEVVAIGNPLSLESTVSNGIVSGIRTAQEEGGKFLQVTTPISPGSSGGPLFNMAGEVVGITTLYLKGGENLNFAIPINDAKRFLLTKSSKIQALPDEPEPVKAETQRPSPPAVRDTLQWMQNSLNAGGGDQFKGEETLSIRLIDFSGCRVHFAYTESKDGKEIFRSEPMFNLDDIDPTTISLRAILGKDQPGTNDLFVAHTQNDAKKIVWKVNGAENTDSKVIFIFPRDYGVRFARAFGDAVEVCGGKPSTF
jgi:V8-like Glu-specific endopeptidase